MAIFTDDVVGQNALQWDNPEFWDNAYAWDGVFFGAFVDVNTTTLPDIPA